MNVIRNIMICIIMGPIMTRIESKKQSLSACRHAHQQDVQEAARPPKKTKEK